MRNAFGSHSQWRENPNLHLLALGVTLTRLVEEHPWDSGYSVGPLPNRRSGLSIRNWLTLYKQFIRPMMEYASPIWWHAANSHIRRLHWLRSKCLPIIAGAPWYVRNLKLYEDLEVPSLAEHTRNLAQNFDSKIPDSEKLLVRQLESNHWSTFVWTKLCQQIQIWTSDVGKWYTTKTKAFSTIK